jgi:catechol 2,3-dioxygenase-like lactoylglutathione lyase family enzyme
MLTNLVSLVLLFAMQVAPAPKPSPNLAGIAHVAFHVTDVPKSREFYRALGFEEAFAFNDPGKPPVSYVKVNDRQYIELYQRKDESQPLGLMHVCYEASDLEALHAYYVQQGVDAPAPRKARAGNLLFVLHDPEGQTLEFTQYMPGSLHYEARGKHLGANRVSDQMVRPTIPVKDLETEHSFFKRLGFEDAGSQNGIRLRLPGGSGEGIQLRSNSAPTEVVFAVRDVKRAASELRKRGLKPQENADSVSVSDPDGVVIVLARGKGSR